LLLNRFALIIHVLPQLLQFPNEPLKFRLRGGVWPCATPTVFAIIASALSVGARFTQLQIIASPIFFVSIVKRRRRANSRVLIKNSQTHAFIVKTNRAENLNVAIWQPAPVTYVRDWKREI
jgi:hypothetical protein